MTAPQFFNFTTGSTQLPDIGALSYNNVTFSTLFHSRISGKYVYDNAERTVKGVEYTLHVEGAVVLPGGGVPGVGLFDLPGVAGAQTVDNALVTMRALLEQSAGQLVYTGRGFGSLKVNGPGNVQDLAWGPKPRLLEFIPLGGAHAAMVTWEVTFLIPEYFRPNKDLPMVQFNLETAIAYDDEGFTTLTLRGTLEIPLTRVNVRDTTFRNPINLYRAKYLQEVANGIDLTRFHVTRRHFGRSRDGRTLEWEFVAEELPYMGLPVGATSARGNFSVRPEKQSMALFPWICSLRCTYIIRQDYPRRYAWFHFISLLRYRMMCSVKGVAPKAPAAAAGVWARIPLPGVFDHIPGIGPVVRVARDVVGAAEKALKVIKARVAGPAAERKAWLVGFEVDEGLYLDSRRITFGATWRLLCSFGTVLAASGIWRWPDGPDMRFLSRNEWKASMEDIQGYRSWLRNELAPDADVIVDMGSP